MPLYFKTDEPDANIPRLLAKHWILAGLQRIVTVNFCDFVQYRQANTKTIRKSITTASF